LGNDPRGVAGSGTCDNETPAFIEDDGTALEFGERLPLDSVEEFLETLELPILMYPKERTSDIEVRLNKIAQILTKHHSCSVSRGEKKVLASVKLLFIKTMRAYPASPMVRAEPGSRLRPEPLARLDHPVTIPCARS
jgi:hypothetical protein